MLGTIERVAERTCGNLGVNPRESKQIASPVARHRGKATAARLHEHCEQRRKCLACGMQRPVKDFRCKRLDFRGTVHSGFRDIDVASVTTVQQAPGSCRSRFEYSATPLSGSAKKVDQLVAAYATKFFPRNDCPITNEFAPKIIAKDLIYKTALTSGAGTMNTNMSEHEEHACSSREFLGLKNGGLRIGLNLRPLFSKAALIRR
jgi:hypothetical protein